MQRRTAGALLRSLSVVGAGLAVTALAVGVSTPAAAAAGDPSTLIKSAQDVTHPGANPVGHADTLNWVLSYADNGPAGASAAAITDPIDAAGTNQTYVPGSLRVPPGWTPSWSTDGTTFQHTDPGTGTVAVQATNPTARQGGTNLGNLLLAPVQPTPTATGGDGFTPIVHRTTAGEVEAWNIYHHLGAAAPKVVCSDLTTGSPCTGGPWPRPINTAVGPLGAGATGDIASTLTPQYVQDPTRPGVVYYAAITATSIGVGCLDMDAQANCGYVPLATGGPATLAGFVTTGGDLYGVAGDGRVLCMTISSRTPCANEPYAAIVPGNAIGAGGNFMGSLTVAAGKVFASSSQGGGTAPVLGCFDPTTQAACTGWTTPKPVGPGGSSTFNAYTAFDTSGNAVGACATTVGSPNSVSTCYALDGSAITAPTVFNSLPSENVWNAETASAPDGDLQSYFGIWGAVGGATVCWDWTTRGRVPRIPGTEHPSDGQRRCHPGLRLLLRHHDTVPVRAR